MAKRKKKVTKLMGIFFECSLLKFKTAKILLVSLNISASKSSFKPDIHLLYNMLRCTILFTELDYSRYLNITYLVYKSWDEFGFKYVTKGNPVQKTQQCFKGCTHKWCILAVVLERC